jgi:hypothetical protein
MSFPAQHASKSLPECFEEGGRQLLSSAGSPINRALEPKLLKIVFVFDDGSTKEMSGRDIDNIKQTSPSLVDFTIALFEFFRARKEKT